MGLREKERGEGKRTGGKGPEGTRRRGLAQKQRMREKNNKREKRREMLFAEFTCETRRKRDEFDCERDGLANSTASSRPITPCAREGAKEQSESTDACGGEEARTK